jgi:hypothetical protein
MAEAAGLLDARNQEFTIEFGVVVARHRAVFFVLEGGYCTE